MTNQMDSVLPADTEALWTPRKGYQRRFAAAYTVASVQSQTVRRGLSARTRGCDPVPDFGARDKVAVYRPHDRSGEDKQLQEEADKWIVQHSEEERDEENSEPNAKDLRTRFERPHARPPVVRRAPAAVRYEHPFVSSSKPAAGVHGVNGNRVQIGGAETAATHPRPYRYLPRWNQDFSDVELDQGTDL